MVHMCIQDASLLSNALASHEATCILYVVNSRDVHALTHGLSKSTKIIQVNKKFCELKGGNIGIVEKAQETRFGMSPKYSRYIGIAF